MSTTSPPESWQIGRHRCHVDASNIFTMTIVGDISPAEAIELMTLAKRVAEERPYLLGLGDVTRMTTISAEARKAMTSVPLSRKQRYLAVFGASFSVRVLATLTSKLRDLLSPGPRPPMRMFNTEPEARAWLDERRRTVERVSSAPSIAAP